MINIFLKNILRQSQQTSIYAHPLKDQQDHLEDQLDQDRPSEKYERINKN